MNIDKDLLQYCKDKEFPIREMNEKDFKTVENTVDFQYYKLGLEFKKSVEKLYFKWRMLWTK